MKVLGAPFFAVNHDGGRVSFLLEKWVLYRSMNLEHS